MQLFPVPYINNQEDQNNENLHRKLRLINKLLTEMFRDTSLDLVA